MEKYYVIEPSEPWSDEHQSRIGQCGEVKYITMPMSISFNIDDNGNFTTNDMKTEYHEDNSIVFLVFDDGKELSFNMKSLAKLREFNLKNLDI